MKKNFVLLMFVMLTATSWCQEAPKKASKIILTDTSLAYESHFKATLKMLLKSGYQFESSDINTEMIITQPKELHFGFLNGDKATVKLTIEYNTSTKPFEVYITGTITGTLIGSADDLKIANKGMKGSASKETWLELEKMAKLIPHTSISYVVE